MKRKYIMILPFLLLTGCSNISNNVYKDIIINKINDYNYHIKDAKTFNKKSYNEAKEKVIKDINNTKNNSKIKKSYNSFTKDVSNMFCSEKIEKDLNAKMEYTLVEPKHYNKLLRDIEFKTLNEMTYYYGNYENMEVFITFHNYHNYENIKNIEVYNCTFSYNDDLSMLLLNKSEIIEIDFSTSSSSIENKLSKDSVSSIYNTYTNLIKNI